MFHKSDYKLTMMQYAPKAFQDMQHLQRNNYVASSCVPPVSTVHNWIKTAFLFNKKSVINCKILWTW